MLLQKIKLENIRSYTSEEINFSKGSLLLSGDIGSGKSTILLAVEFALFGIMKGDISGSELLRHGEKNGSVELHLKIAGKNVIIKRALKRGSAGIGQDSGYIVINDVKTDLVAKELKARILELLGYSQEFVNKSKSLIYRYTVYTPQEEMKRIILAKPEERLDTLRNVFGIDKYKRIRENVVLYVRELRRNLSYIEGQTQDLEEIKKSLTDKLEVKKTIHLDVEKQRSITQKTRKDVDEKRKRIQELEDEVNKIKEDKSKIELITQKIKTINNTRETYEQSNSQAKEKISDLEKQLGDTKKINQEKLNERISLLKKKIDQDIEKQESYSKKIAELEFQINESNKLVEKIVSLTKCPTCEQEVDKGHKHKISDENKKTIETAKRELKEIEEKKKELLKEKLSWQEKLEGYQELKNKHETNKTKLEFIEELRKQIKIREETIEKHNKDKNELLDEEKLLKEKTKDFDDKLKLFEKEKQGFQALYDVEKQEEVKLARLVEQEKSLDVFISGLKNQVEVKEGFIKKASKIKKVQNFLSEFFENLMISMEKHVMASIYHEFNSLVSKWFDTLIDDDNLSLKLENDFTPTLIQNGYETEITNLSGGEKTSVALAYRLALNKVINDMVSGINTKDLIILDEPTDGFSSEQLDRVRDVIEDLELGQIIIVSHEPKIESFVQNIIRIEKEGHESRVIS